MGKFEPNAIKLEVTLERDVIINDGGDDEDDADGFWVKMLSADTSDVFILN